MIKKNKISQKNTENEEVLLCGFISGKTTGRRAYKASTSAVAHEQNNAGVDRGEKALLEIVMAGFETLNKSIAARVNNNMAGSWH